MWLNKQSLIFLAARKTPLNCSLRMARTDLFSSSSSSYYSVLRQTHGPEKGGQGVHLEDIPSGYSQAQARAQTAAHDHLGPGSKQYEQHDRTTRATPRVMVTTPCDTCWIEYTSMMEKAFWLLVDVFVRCKSRDVGDAACRCVTPNLLSPVFPSASPFDINENSSIFRPLPTSDVDIMGKKRFVGKDDILADILKIISCQKAS